MINPVLPVERKCCFECLFYLGCVDPELSLTFCDFPVFDKVEDFYNSGMTFFHYTFRDTHPEYVEMYESACPCFVDKNALLQEFRDKFNSEE